MRKIPTSRVVHGHPDFELLLGLKVSLENCSGGADALKQKLPLLFREAIDEVIDTPRSGRRLISELEKTEKTYIGTKLEILIRNFLGLPKGLLDLEINGLDVDIKNTIGNNWMIPTEAIGKPCILVACNENVFRCYAGIFIAHFKNLSTSANKDSKRSVSAVGFENILWILNDAPYPPNFWASVEERDARYIMEPIKVGGSERLRRLFSKILNRPISRDVIQGVARQKDYMKRLRSNGGARDKLAREGIAILSGQYDSILIEALKLPHCGPDEFISVRADTEEVAMMLGAAGHSVEVQ